jgi:MYXO-CTERM domain-containing protein
MKKRPGLILGVLAAVALPAGAARAQSLRPNILVIFDTSGSMLLNQASDGSPLCAGAGTSSRVYSLKKALRDAMAQVGTDEANFGLMRFPQIEDPTLSFTCPRAHWSLAGTSLGSLNGCRLTTQSTTTPETTYGPWFDSGISEALLVPVTKASSGLKPAASTDFDPADGNLSEVYRWIDLTDAGATGPNNPDPELRIPANTSTPLGRSLFYARLYFENYIYTTTDPKRDCRTNLIIVATDGAETCDATKGSTAKLDTTTCIQTPLASYATFHPEVQACNLNHSSVIPKGVQTYILTDNGLTTAEKATANLIAAAGGTSQAIFVTLTDTSAVKQALVNIIAKTVPPTEVCNGVDDNCNGQIDEGVKNTCALDTDPAHAGHPELLTQCQVETCNCLDDNCNGVVDEGLKPNACGGPCGCAVPAETCNGLDDNCNGDIDEGFNIGVACDNGLKGACHRTGITACNAAGTGTTCDAPAVTPTQEVCNNIDDNCDGRVDEGTLPGVGVACGIALGNCQAGVTMCVNGQIICSAVAMPMTEICNGQDDNCDGVIDNGVFPETGMDCLCPGLSAAQVGIGECRGGHLICRGTRGFVCEGCVLPTAEICDGKDNDCDGTVDVSATCPTGLGCKEGQCAVNCRPGEVPCSGAYKCVNNFCVPLLCANVTCSAGTRCDETSGRCVDVCAGVVCAAPKTCQNGSCVDCNNFGCATGQLCVAGQCQVDKCVGVTCAATQYCADGKCVALCTPDMCAANQRCVAGQCLPDTCANVGCPDDQFCDPVALACKADPCDVEQCPKGQTCVKTTGLCATDPCITIDCPGPCWQCGTTSDGIGTCKLSGDCREVTTKIGTRGGAGCGCSVDGAGGAPRSPAALGLVALGLVAVLAARRRRSRGEITSARATARRPRP